MSADSDGDMHAVRAALDIEATVAARAAATASPQKKLAYSSGSSSPTSNVAVPKKLKEDRSSGTVSDESELPVAEDREEEEDVGEDVGNGETWTKVPTRNERAQFQATRKAERTVRRLNRTFGPAAAGFEVDFSPTDDSQRFSAENLLRIFCDVRQVVLEDQPRLNARVGITVKVPCAASD